jgi:hypothetical protein
MTAAIIRRTTHRNQLSLAIGWNAYGNTPTITPTSPGKNKPPSDLSAPTTSKVTVTPIKIPNLHQSTSVSEVLPIEVKVRNNEGARATTDGIPRYK